MPSAYVDEGMHRPCMLATCWAQGMSGSPTIPARVMTQDTQALLDTGSVVTLLRPKLAGGRKGEPMEVTCVHGDTQTYGTCHVVVRTPYGVFTARAGIVRFSLDSGIRSGKTGRGESPRAEWGGRLGPGVRGHTDSG